MADDTDFLSLQHELLYHAMERAHSPGPPASRLASANREHLREDDSQCHDSPECIAQEDEEYQLSVLTASYVCSTVETLSS